MWRRRLSELSIINGANVWASEAHAQELGVAE